MNELTYVYGTLVLMAGTFLIQLATRKFDPFAPIWLFFVGYFQVYVVQAISYHDWSLQVRGVEVVTAANFRAFWALAWFLGVYFFGPGRVLARGVIRPPERWGVAPVVVLSPVLIVWGLACARYVMTYDTEGASTSAEASLILSFPLVMLVAGVILIVTGRQPSRPRPEFVAAGIAVILLYMMIWMFNGKRSHSLVAVLVGVCCYYVPTLKRPTFPVLFATAIAGAMAVGISISWRYYSQQHADDRSFSKFANFIVEFDPNSVLTSFNLADREHAKPVKISYETEEYGGFLLMMDTVPNKADYDYGENYLRLVSTFIPRIFWPGKPIYGREQWAAAWVAGSEQKRKMDFTGPAIGILGATQLNGGAVGTLIVLGVVATFLRTSYEYFRLHAHVPWVQAWWPLSFYNAWFMTVNDDPANWFYYNYGFTTLPFVVLLFVINKSPGRSNES